MLRRAPRELKEAAKLEVIANSARIERFLRKE
jgi:hypothetical protein